MTDNIKSYEAYVLLDCPYCKKAIQLLQEKKKVFSVTVLDYDRERLALLKEKFSWQTVPLIVMKNDKDEELLLGGFSDLEQTFSVPT